MEQNKILTAEQIANKWALDDGDLLHDAAIEAMKEFAQMHVKAALEAAAEKALVYQKCDNYHTGENVWEDKSDEVYITVINDYSYDEHHSISTDKQSILNTFEQTYLKHKV